MLILSFGVPPTPGPNPARGWHFARHLPSHGWEAILLTPRHPKRRMTVDKTREHRSYPIPIRRVYDPSGAPFWLQETGYRDLLYSMRHEEGTTRTALPGLYGKQSRAPEEIALERPPSPTNPIQKLICWTRCNPDARAGWVTPGLKAARAVCQMLKPDAVYSYSPPVSAHRIAMRVAENLKIPWVADLREPWSGGSPSFLDGWRRSRILRCASVYQLLPSFDPVDLAGAGESGGGHRDPAVLVHAGPTSTHGRDPRILLEAIRHLLDAKAIDPNRLRVRFLDPRDPRLAKEIGARFLSGIVTIEPEAPWEISIETQAEASGLLLALGPGDRGRIPDRMIEALAARKLLLAFGPKSDPAAGILQATGIGVICDESVSLAGVLKAHLMDGCPRPSSVESAIAGFRAETVVRGVVELIEKETG